MEPLRPQLSCEDKLLPAPIGARLRSSPTPSFTRAAKTSFLRRSTLSTDELLLPTVIRVRLLPSPAPSVMRVSPAKPKLLPASIGSVVFPNSGCQWQAPLSPPTHLSRSLISFACAALLPLALAPFSFACVVLPSGPSPSLSLALSASLPSALRFPTAATGHPSSHRPFASSLPSSTTATTAIIDSNSDASIFHHLASLPSAIVDSGASIFHLPSSILSSGASTFQSYAAKILPVVKNQHLLLCTLLIGISLSMEALLIFLDSLVPSLGAILLSVTLILAFGEWISYVTPSGRLIQVMMTRIHLAGKVYHFRAKRQIAKSLGQVAKFNRRYGIKTEDEPEKK
ncbi:hypothetical protein ACLOJK_012014 [Asimina triloba]